MKRMNHSWMALLLCATGVIAQGDPARGGEPRYTKPGPSDRAITQAIERGYMRDEFVPFDPITVHTEAGIVTLSGQVPSLLAKDQAQRLAETIKGVRAVVNRLGVEPRPRSDRELKHDIERSLLIRPATTASGISVSVENGIATLGGTVDSSLEQELVDQVAKGVKGLRDVRNETTVRFETTPSDAELAKQIERQLRADPWLDARLLWVKVLGGRAVLHGTVGSALEKSRAAYHAWMAGVKSVDDKGVTVEWWARNEMRRGKYPERSDDEIQDAVKDAFLSDPRVLSFRPSVEVHAGTVTLRGAVGTLEAKRAAEQDARNAIGAQGVRNYLTVKPVEVTDDETIAEHVQWVLHRDPVLHDWDITAVVHRGVVVLSGMADSPRQRERAEDLVTSLNGVLAVRNLIHVEPVWTWKGDSDIKEDIESELFWSPFVTASDINVSVTDGVVTLQGQVDSPFERAMALENAREGGARIVQDHLEVSNDQS